MAQEMEAVFLAQLFQAMRASVPQDGLTGPSPEQDLFTALLDERVASIAAARMKRGMSEVLYRQLSRRLPAAGAGGTR
jgi:Rod binding domain-containing protein